MAAVVSDETRRLDGLGAVVFLATFAGIAYFVQSRTVDEARDVEITPVTAVAEAAPEEVAPVLPWEDRLALDKMALEVLSPGGGKSQDASEGAAPTDSGAPATKVDPDAGAYVQTLSDGHRVLWTLDPVLQSSALTIFQNREVPYAGAVVLDLEDNAVLAFAGHSSADANVDPLEVLTTAWAPAASTFKLITAASLLEHKDATPASKICFFGGLHGITDEALRDDPARDTRCESLSAAIAHSYNLVIGKLALRGLDQDELVSTAHRMQYEAPISFEFPVERSPIDIPSEARERARVAAGFWHVDLSPVHAALVASIFARDGIYEPPISSGKCEAQTGRASSLIGFNPRASGPGRGARRRRDDGEDDDRGHRPEELQGRFRAPFHPQRQRRREDGQPDRSSGPLLQLQLVHRVRSCGGPRDRIRGAARQ